MCMRNKILAMTAHGVTNHLGPSQLFILNEGYLILVLQFNPTSKALTEGLWHLTSLQLI